MAKPNDCLQALDQSEWLGMIGVGDIFGGAVVRLFALHEVFDAVVAIEIVFQRLHDDPLRHTAVGHIPHLLQIDRRSNGVEVDGRLRHLEAPFVDGCLSAIRKFHLDGSEVFTRREDDSAHFTLVAAAYSEIAVVIVRMIMILVFSHSIY